MGNAKKKDVVLHGPRGDLPVKAHDRVGRQLAMLFECRCLGTDVLQTAAKYGYSRQRYFQVQQAFRSGGTAALMPRKPGPRGKHVRTEVFGSQVVRHKFLDPDASAEVIAQKMRQCGLKTSIRSVQRTIAEYGLQKKTVCIPTASAARH